MIAVVDRVARSGPDPRRLAGVIAVLFVLALVPMVLFLGRDNASRTSAQPRTAQQQPPPAPGSGNGTAPSQSQGQGRRGQAPTQVAGNGAGGATDQSDYGTPDRDEMFPSDEGYPTK